MSRQDRSIAYVVIVVLSVLLVIPALNGAMFLHDSHAINLVWADQFTAELRKGVLYPRWLPLSHDGLGSPTFYFYPPLAFYVSGLFGLAGLSTYHSLIAAFASFFALSGIGMWHWLQVQSPRPLLGALLFMVLPYHLMDFTLRGALAESLAFALLPFVAIGLRRVKEGRGGGLLAATYGVMILSHLPLALLTSLFLIVPYALWHRGRLWHFAPPLALGIGLSCIFLLPALGLAPFRDAAQLYADPNLIAENWTIWRADFSRSGRSIFLALCLSLLVVLGVLAILRRDRWAIGGVGVTLLGLGIIPHFWSMPILEQVQFPWRSLAIAEFALATALSRVKRVSISVVVALVPTLLLSAVVVTFVRISPVASARTLLTTHREVTEMLPPGVVRQEREELLADPAVLKQGRMPPPQVAGKTVRPIFYFPRWSCGEPEPQTKLLMHPPSCTPEPVMTGWEKVGAAISLLSLLGIGSFAWVAGRRRA